MKRLGIPLLVVILAGAAWFGRGFWPQGEAQRVRQMLDRLASDVSFGPKEGNIAAVNRISSVLDRFTSDCGVEVEILGVGTFQIHGRDELQQALMATTRAARRVALQFHDPVVEIAGDGVSAHVHLTATAEAEGRGRNQDGFEAIEFEFNLVKEEGRWRVRQVRTIPTLRQ